jgi:hypothetical protein
MGCGAMCKIKQDDLDKNYGDTSKHNASFDEDFRAILDGDMSGEEKLIAMAKNDPQGFKRLLENSFGKESKTRTLDNNTRCFRELVNKVKGANEKATKKVPDICIPKEKKELDFFKLDGVIGMGVPTDDEDWPDRGAMQQAIMGMSQEALIGLLKALPCSDELHYFDSVEEGILVGDMSMKGVLPVTTEVWKDLTSDNAMSLLAFWGIGQVFLAGQSNGGYSCDITLLADFAVRPKFEKYGANAVFDKNGKIESIFWSAGACVVKPGEGKKWEHAKWAWKASLGAAVTAVTHLVQLHWIIVNATHVACRQQLGADHPVRRALKVFLYNTGGVNFGSTMSLYPEDSFLHRMSALEYDGLVASINAGDASYKYMTHPEWVASKNLGEDMKAKIPICTDGMKVWDIYRAFFDGYVKLYFPNETDVTNDEELKAYWESINTRGGLGSPYKYGLPDLSRDALVDQMTHHAFQATCWHEFVGAIVHYLTTPEGLATKIVPDVEVMDVQTFFQGLCLIGLTGTRQPTVISDWTHLFLEGEKNEAAKKLHTTFMDQLNKLSKEIDALNEKAETQDLLKAAKSKLGDTTDDKAKRDLEKQIKEYEQLLAKAPKQERDRVVNSFNPKYFECSVSV